ncbi:O-methylsterigmatocystin oxidoreductase [Obba rivulosa]|uniref:O-methylsterigmatocystin oxidoreductase n=1 Tax=Obba rivulosa TaxID=1052685 RepID=A0A8E2ARN9_9APHY|nr:O-methylsterigmatocystin oxidoreductase [Obba rivulosa]
MGLLLAVFFVSLVSVLLWHVKNNAYHRKLPYPPGPRGWPVIGNVLDIPVSYPWITYRDLSLKYGPIVYLQALGQSMVVLNTAKAASDLLEARSANYSDRSHSIMPSFLGQDWNMGFLLYGPRWRKHRRAIHQYFNTGVIHRYQPVQLQKARQLLLRLLPDHTDVLPLVDFTIGATIIQIAYGYVAEEVDDKYLKLVRNAAHEAINTLIPGKYLVEFLPFLQHIPAWFPGAVFKREAEHCKAVQREMIETLFEDFQTPSDSGDANASILAQLLDRLTPDGHEGVAIDDMEVVKNTASIAYAAGADTTTITMRVFFAAMVLHPEMQRRGQEELATVVGDGRLPEFSDRTSLPYINAIAKECTRWMPVAPLGVPHASLADDEYNGYVIPQGSIMIANQWAILHDPVEYPDPEMFIPERFIKDGKMNPNVKDPGAIAFGFGRRICPGRHFSDATLFINIASLMHVFDILPWLDEHGTPELPEARAVSAFLSGPVPFKCVVKPRSSSAEQLINALH